MIGPLMVDHYGCPIRVLWICSHSGCSWLSGLLLRLLKVSGDCCLIISANHNFYPSSCFLYAKRIGKVHQTPSRQYLRCTHGDGGLPCRSFPASSCRWLWVRATSDSYI